MDQSELAPDYAPKYAHPVVHFSVTNETEDRNEAENKQAEAEPAASAAPPQDTEEVTENVAVTTHADGNVGVTAETDWNTTATSHCEVNIPVTETETETETKTPIAKEKRAKKSNAACGTAKSAARKDVDSSVDVPNTTNAAGYDRLLRVNAVKDYLGWSVFALICCCFPLNVVGLMHTIMTREAKRYGDVNRAEKKSLKAKNWLMASTSTGATIIGTWLVLQFYWYR